MGDFVTISYSDKEMNDEHFIVRRILRKCERYFHPDTKVAYTLI